MIRFRFQILLPIAFLVLSVVLAKVGQAERNKTIQVAINARTGRVHEFSPEYWATARFVDYIVNAPAWAASRAMPRVLHLDGGPYWGIMRFESDWWYLLFVAVMWFLIGRQLDRRSYKNKPRLANASSWWWPHIVRVLLAAYGAFICYNAVEYSQPPWDYPSWFTYPVFVWGAVLCLVSLYRLFRRPGNRSGEPVNA